MPSTDRLRFFTIALSLILSLFSLLSARTTFASRNLHCAQSTESHSPAYQEGMDAHGKGDYEKAAEHFKRAAADKPKDMWAFYYFGLCLLKLKRFDEAVTAYQQAAALRPKAAAVYYQLGKTYLGMGDQEAAEKVLHLLEEHNPELALYLLDLLHPDKPASKQLQEITVPSATAQNADDNILPMTSNLRPTILYREKAKYTEMAKINLVEGTVVLKAVFASNGEMQDIRVIRGLPDGLTRKAIEATRKIKFNPATRDGEPVSVRGNLEFTFNLY
jgi:TonB family protein